MKVFSAKRISKTYGEKDVFVDLDFHIQEKDKIGIVGVNGTGKSSLLRVIAGVEEPDTGSFASPKDYTVGYLAQVPELDDRLTVLEIVFQGKSSLMELVKEYEEVLAKLDKNPKNELYQQQLFDLQRKMDAENAWDAVTNAETILSKLGFANVNEKAAYLSGGQRKRAALAQVLVDTPDLLLLDEPTNHLDYGSIQWLEEYLRKYDKAFVVVSHDRYFLDRVTNRMAELHDGNIYFYDGNYQSYIEAKALREEEMLAEKKRRNMYRRELEWIKRGAKARSTKQKARIQRFEQLEAKLGGFSTGENPDITIGSSRLGKKVFEFMNASKSFDHKTIMSEFNWIVKPGDRIGIVGENGSGKSTFLNILAGETVLDTGTLDIGPTVKTAYYRQTNEDMNGDHRMIAYIQELGNEIETSSGDVLSAAQMLERFLFPKHTHGTLIRKLSGGEKRRLYLLRLLMSKPNVLLLDEPTNDLDTETLTVLEDFIEEFPGVVISVSHDRYFLDKTAKELLVFHGNGRIDHYYGSFTDYIEEKKEQLAEVPVDRKVESKKEATLLASKKKMTYKEKKEWETIEKDIEQVEEKLEVLQQELNDTGSDFERAQEIMEKIQNESANLEHLIQRWTYLSELDNESF